MKIAGRPHPHPDPPLEGREAGYNDFIKLMALQQKYIAETGRLAGEG